jgi:hypothetical protein
MSIYNLQIVSHFQQLISYLMRETKDKHKAKYKAIEQRGLAID